MDVVHVHFVTNEGIFYDSRRIRDAGVFAGWFISVQRCTLAGRKRFSVGVLALYAPKLVTDFQVGTARLAHEITVFAEAEVCSLGVLFIQQVGQAQAG
jgi:hypothetical protein